MREDRLAQLAGQPLGYRQRPLGSRLGEGDGQLAVRRDALHRAVRGVGERGPQALVPLDQRAQRVQHGSELGLP